MFQLLISAFLSISIAKAVDFNKVTGTFEPNDDRKSVPLNSEVLESFDTAVAGRQPASVEEATEKKIETRRTQVNDITGTFN